MGFFVESSITIPNGSSLFRKMRTPNAPFTRIEIIGSVPEIFHETQRFILIGNQHKPQWQMVQRNSLAAQIGNGLFIRHFLPTKSIRVQLRTHCQCMCRDKVAAFFIPDFDTQRHHPQLLGKRQKDFGMRTRDVILPLFSTKQKSSGFCSNGTYSAISFKKETPRYLFFCRKELFIVPRFVDADFRNTATNNPSPLTLWGKNR